MERARRWSYDEALRKNLSEPTRISADGLSADSRYNDHAMDAPEAASRPPWQVSGIRAVERVLIVDDEPDSAEMMAEMLAALGYQTRFALDGTSALALAGAFEPQVVLMDVSLPDMDGYQVARQLRADPRFRAALLVAVTGWSGKERELKAREAGFDDYIVKPVQLEALQSLFGR